MADTTVFRVAFYDEAGNSKVRRVEARSDEEALRLVGVRRSRTRSVSADPLSGVIQLLNRDRPSLDIQASVLNVFAAQVSGGQNAGDTFDRIVSGYRKFRSKLDEVKQRTKISEKMKVLDFDPQLILLAEVGEASGMVGEVLSGAADDVIEQGRVRSQIMTSLVPSIAIALFGLLVMLVLPVYLYESVIDIMESPGVNFKDNPATDFLLFFGKYTPIYWIHGIAVLVLIFLTRKTWWPWVKKIPGLSIIEEFLQIGAAYRFVASFTPLISRGMQVQSSLELLTKHSQGRQKRAYEAVLAHLKRGGAVGAGFDDETWHPTLQECMRGYDQVRDEDRPRLLERIKPLMGNQLNRVVFKMNAIFGGLGLGLSVGVVLIVFMGMMLPLLTLSVG